MAEDFIEIEKRKKKEISRTFVDAEGNIDERVLKTEDEITIKIPPSIIFPIHPQVSGSTLVNRSGSTISEGAFKKN